MTNEKSSNDNVDDNEEVNNSEIDTAIAEMRAESETLHQTDSGVFEDTVPDTPSSQFGLISTSGICLSCEDADAMCSYVVCFICSEKFHGVCRDAQGDKNGNETISTRSFFRGYDRMINSDKYKERPGSFVFICDVCMTNHEAKQAIKQETKIDMIDKRVDKLSDSMEEMKHLLHQAINRPVITSESLPSPHESQSFSYSNALKNPNPLKRSVLIVDEPEGDTPNSGHIEKVITDNSIHIEKSYKNKKGSTVYICPTEKDRNSLNDKLSSNLPLLKKTVPPERLPTIGIANLSTKYSNEDLTKLILQAHPDIKDCVDKREMFKVLNVKPHLKDTSKYQATIRISSHIRSIIESHGDRLYIGLFSCSVFDRFYVKRCNKCQKFNHYMSECKETLTVCGHCSENHESNACPKRETAGFHPCCINCKKSKNESVQHSHSAFDRSCPTYVTEQDKLRKSITFYNSKNC